MLGEELRVSKGQVTQGFIVKSLTFPLSKARV